MQEHVGTLLWEMRTARGLSVGELARRAAISKATLSYWEAGTRQPRVPELETVLVALHATETQRAQALAVIDAPRSMRQLRLDEPSSGLGTPPVLGDLLRAMRLRRGWTQEQTAAALEVTQATIARWERGERQPTTALLHALCFALHAQPEEVTTLTAEEGFVVASPNQNRAERLERIRYHLMKIVNPPTPTESRLWELEMIAMERELWTDAVEDQEARDLLATVFASHAESYRNRLIWTDVVPLARRALALVSPSSPRPILLRASLMAAAGAVYGGVRTAPERGFHQLKNLLEVSDNPVFSAWILSDMAKYAALAGQTQTSLSLAGTACKTANASESVGEVYLRRMDHGRLLLQAGQPRAALRVLPEPICLSDAQYRDDLLLMADAHTQADNPHEAHAWRERAAALTHP